MKVGDKVRITESHYPPLDGMVGIIAQAEDNIALVDFGQEIDLGEGNILHGGNMGNGKKQYYWFRVSELSLEPVEFIQVLVTYIIPEWGRAHRADAYIEEEPITIEAAIQNALLELGLSRRPELVVSVTAVKIKRV